VSGTDAEGLISLCAAPAVARPHLPAIGARPAADHRQDPGGRRYPRRAIAAELNDKGISAPRGDRWSATAVMRVEKAIAARM
jgi:hypothetical protein